MRNTEMAAAFAADARRKMLNTAFELFTEKSIDAVPLSAITKASGVGDVTVYRYFGTKLDLVVAVCAWKWSEYLAENRRKHDASAQRSGREELAFFLDSFIELYREHPELLRFNEMFGIYIHGTGVSREQLKPYTDMIADMAERFRADCWEKGVRDGTLRGGMPWQSAFSALLHIMLAAATRYAAGLMYQPESGAEPLEELAMLRELLLSQYAVEEASEKTITIHQGGAFAMTENMKRFLELVSQEDEAYQMKLTELDKDGIIALAAERGITISAEDLEPRDDEGEVSLDEAEAVAGGKECNCSLAGSGKKGTSEQDKNDRTCKCFTLGAGHDMNGNGRCYCLVGGSGIACGWLGGVSPMLKQIHF